MNHEPEFGVVEEIDGADEVLTVSIANETGMCNEDFRNLIRAHARREAPEGIRPRYRWKFRNWRIVHAEIIFEELPGNVSVTEIGT